MGSFFLQFVNESCPIVKDKTILGGNIMLLFNRRENFREDFMNEMEKHDMFKNFSEEHKEVMYNGIYQMTKEESRKQKKDTFKRTLKNSIKHIPESVKVIGTNAMAGVGVALGINVGVGLITGRTINESVDLTLDNYKDSKHIWIPTLATLTVAGPLLNGYIDAKAEEGD